MWPMFGNTPPMYSLGQPTTNSNTINFTGGPWTFTRTAQASAAETIATFKISDDATGKLEIKNANSTDTIYQPWLKGTTPGTTEGFAITSAITTDSGGAGVLVLQGQMASNAAVTSRPIVRVLNYASTILDILPLNSGAHSCLSWGTQGTGAPSTAARSNGTRLILYNAFSAGSLADYAIGMGSAGPWIGTAGSTSGYELAVYGAANKLAMFRGDGVFALGNPSLAIYSRLSQKIETNTSANYGGVALNAWTTGTAEAPILDFNKSASATIGTQGAVASTDRLGLIVWRGSDGTQFRDAASIDCYVDGTPGASDMPGRIRFLTTPDGSVTSVERARITNAGDVGIGKTPTTGIMLDLNGVLGLKSYTVGTLPSAATQAGGTVYVSDAAGSPCIALSNGTNWKRCDDCTVTVT